MVKKIIITGASRGIGKEVAIEFAKLGHQLVLLARDEDRLAGICKSLKELNKKVFYKVCDVTYKNQMNDSVNYAIQKMGGIDIAILNSGIAGSGYFENFDSDNFKRIFNVNVFGLLYGMEFLIPIMKKQGSGTIAGVSSLADARGFPGNAAYSASKSSASFILESARVELARFGINVVTIKPGFVKTDLIAKNTFYMPLLMEADKAAKIIVSGILSGKKRIAFPLPMVFLTYIVKILPSAVYEFLIKLYGKPINE
ncbi:MAG: SDR family NAD(P)-dependent oxidoreductase [bacterium]